MTIWLNSENTQPSSNAWILIDDAHKSERGFVKGFDELTMVVRELQVFVTQVDLPLGKSYNFSFWCVPLDWMLAALEDGSVPVAG